MGIWFDPTEVLSPQDALIDLNAPWLNEGEAPPLGEAVAAEVNPLHSDETPPSSHPGSPLAPPDCPLFVKHLNYDPGPCGGLRDAMRERADDYQRTVIQDPIDWANRFGEWPRRDMRNSSAVTAYRLVAHYARPYDRGQYDRDQLLADAVLHFGSTTSRSHLQQWAETADFAANGLLRLLYLYSHLQYARDPEHPTGLEPLIPCRLQEEAKAQLLGFKYFGDEPARRPDRQNDEPGSKNEAVYWSENHQVLYATAEYLAGQLMPDELFQPELHWREDGPARSPGDCTAPKPPDWKTATDPNWGMRGTQRMERAYPRLVRWLDHRLMFGFSEWNSPVYYEFDIAALLNLIDFCDDRAVADKAAIALDLVLFDLARFSGWGQAGATSGRAYPSHKYSGWGATTADTLQILFGNWQPDPAREDVLETWRIEAFDARRTEYLNGVRAAAYERAKDAGSEHAGEEADAIRDREAFCWDNANPVAFERAKRPPIGKTWVAADSVGAHSLASSDRYCVPDLFQAFAVNPEAPWFERSRVSIGFEEGKRDYGIGYTGQPDVLAWWSRGGFGTTQTIVGSRDLANAWDVEHKEPFSKIPGLFTLLEAQLVAGAGLMSVESEGSCLTTANLALWREKGVALSSVQKFRFGQVGRQAHIWQATLGPYVGVWSTYPAAESSEYDGDGPSWWSGNAAQPRVVQLNDALICIHDSNLLSYTNFSYGHRSHAWFPVAMFDDAFEVRPDPEDEESQSLVIDLHTYPRQQQVRRDRAINANRGGVWFFGRVGDAFIGMFSAKSGTHLKTDGRWAGREILCEDRVNVFICQVGSKDRFTSFDNFIAECCAAKIYVAKGVYQPSNPFVDIDCSYQMPRGENLWLKLEDRWPVYDGKPLRDEEFPRWENPWNFVPWRTRDYVLSGPTFGGPTRTLHHDCVTGARSGTGL